MVSPGLLPSSPVLGGWALASFSLNMTGWHFYRTEIFSGKSVAHEDIKYEQACILYNLGELHGHSPWSHPPGLPTQVSAPRSQRRRVEEDLDSAPSTTFLTALPDASFLGCGESRTLLF